MSRQAPHRAQQVEDEARAQREAERSARRVRERALARQQARLDELETEIHRLEARMQELAGELDAAGYDQDVSRVAELGAEYRRIEVEVNRLLEEWARVAEAPQTA
jgi:predicted phage-related endonuclease